MLSLMIENWILRNEIHSYWNLNSCKLGMNKYHNAVISTQFKHCPLVMKGNRVKVKLEWRFFFVHYFFLKVSIKLESSCNWWANSKVVLSILPYTGRLLVQIHLLICLWVNNCVNISYVSVCMVFPEHINNFNQWIY